MKPEEICAGGVYFTRDDIPLGTRGVTARHVMRIFEQDGERRVEYHFGQPAATNFEMPLEDFAAQMQGEYL